jgi:LuxR family quorum sensing-dependent transcriptional regulator
LETTVQKYAFDIIDRLRDAPDGATVFAELKAVMARFGFHALLVSGVPVPGERMEPLVMANGWPDGWTKRYMSQDFAADDPTLRRLRQTHNPFLWSETRTPGLSRPQLRVLDEATEFGLHEGVIIPIHAGFGFEAGVSFGGDKVDLAGYDIAALHLIGLYGYDALCRHKPPGDGERGPILTQREQECVKWTAAGKTAWEIGQILGISEATVNQHLHAAARKMNTVSKAHLVARCLRAGLIF